MENNELKEYTKNLTCIICPMGCQLEAAVKKVDPDDVQITVTGNACKRGEEYAKKELTLPMRTLTCTVCVKNGKRPLVSAKTKGEIPKDLLLDAMQYVRRLVINAPVTAGQVIDFDFLQTGVPLVAVEDIPCACD